MPPAEHDLQALYERYGHVILHRCRRILGNEEDAMDAVQETFARVIKHHDSFRADASPLTWMYRISTNYCLNQLRNRDARADKRDQHRTHIGGIAGHLPGAEDWELHETVRQLLADTDDETRRIVVHLYFDDMTKVEVAELVGLSVPTVRKRLDDFISRSRRRSGHLALVGTALLALAVAS